MSNYLGQHFLKNTAPIKKIIGELDVQAGETIIEIGPGHGELTIPLATVCEKVGAKIIAIEKDVKMVEWLTTRIAGGEVDKESSSDTTHILNVDILKFLKTPPDAPFKIAGNIPYYITGHLIRLIGELDPLPKCTVLMIQKEVAERICAEPPRMNRLAASVQFWAEPKIIARAPKEDFSPPPEVDSAVIALHTRSHGANGGSATEEHSAKIDAAQYYATVRALFAQPRKTVLNNIAADATTSQKFITKEEITAALAKLGIDPKSRPQDLSIEAIVRIAATF